MHYLWEAAWTRMFHLIHLFHKFIVRTKQNNHVTETLSADSLLPYYLLWLFWLLWNSKLSREKRIFIPNPILRRLAVSPIKGLLFTCFLYLEMQNVVWRLLHILLDLLMLHIKQWLLMLLVSCCCPCYRWCFYSCFFYSCSWTHFRNRFLL